MPYESLKKLHRLVDGFSSYCQSLSSNYSGSGQKVYVAQVYEKMVGPVGLEPTTDRL
jgi:hypothetical protein